VTPPQTDRTAEYFVERFLSDPNATLPRILVRAAECELMSKETFARPLLDIGSGDGSFARALFDEPVDVGIDNSRPQMIRSMPENIYRHLVQSHGDRLPFKDGVFGTAFSNSTLEHTPDPAAILADMCRVLRPGGVAIITVPSEYFPQFLLGTTLLMGLHLRKGADAYGRFMNRVSRHVHIQPPAVWRGWIEDAGMVVDEWRYYFSHRDTMLLDVAHYVSLPSIVTRAALGRWVLWPGKAQYLPYKQVLSPFSSPGSSERGAYAFFRCRKPLEETPPNG
jgi:SAM-dependent methyltransferase